LIIKLLCKRFAAILPVTVEEFAQHILMHWIVFHQTATLVLRQITQPYMTLKTLAMRAMGAADGAIPLTTIRGIIPSTATAPGAGSFL
jgi:hypothetical protein